MKNINRLDDSRFEIISEAPVMQPIIETYSIDELKRQELSIIESINTFVEQKKKELVKIQQLIVEGEKLGLKTQEVIRAEQVAIEMGKLSEIVSDKIISEQ
jgi:hypothetical protein